VAFFLQYGTQTGLLPTETRFFAAVLAGVVIPCWFRWRPWVS
jgi:uncharacterized membrane protein